MRQEVGAFVDFLFFEAGTCRGFQQALLQY
jgi:hypothetical protein